MSPVPRFRSPEINLERDSKRNCDEIERRLRPIAGCSRLFASEAGDHQAVDHGREMQAGAVTTKPCQTAFWKRSPFQAKKITPQE